MGGGSQYLGTSAWHRHQLGVLGIQRMGQARLAVSNQVEIFALDLQDSPGAQMIRFPLNEERDVLEQVRRIHLEYSKSNQRLNDSGQKSGVRLVVHDWIEDDQSEAANAPRIRDSNVYYVADLKLQRAGDRVVVPGLRIALESLPSAPKVLRYPSPPYLRGAFAAKPRLATL